MNHMTILIVEDNEMNQRLLVRQLARLGISDIAVAANGIDALDWLERHACELVLADCQMPGMDGYEMTRRIRACERHDGRRLPIIALSAGVMQHDKAVCIQAGMDDHVAKPVQLEVLRATLTTWLVGPTLSFPKGSQP
jgi:CheY-like chemotaxis protein